MNKSPFIYCILNILIMGEHYINIFMNNPISKTKKFTLVTTSDKQIPKQFYINQKRRFFLRLIQTNNN